MATSITATEFSRSLSDILNRVKYKGESFLIKRNGEVVAELSPARRLDWPTGAELFHKLKDVPRPDDKFADDLEQVIKEQGPAYFPEWPNS